MSFPGQSGLLATAGAAALLFAVACYDNVTTGVLEDDQPGLTGGNSSIGVAGSEDAAGSSSVTPGGMQSRGGGTGGGSGTGGDVGGTVSGSPGGGAGGIGSLGLGGTGGTLGPGAGGRGGGAVGKAGTGSSLAGMAGMASPPQGTWKEFEGLLTGTCATSTACHGTGAKRAVLRGTGLYDLLMTYAVDDCDSKLLIVPGDLANSALYGTLTGACGKLIMPPACAPDPPCGPKTNITITEAWIQNGAPGP